MKSSAPWPGAVWTTPVTLLERDVLAQDTQRRPVVEWMLESQPFEFTPFEHAQPRGQRVSDLGADLRRQRLGNDDGHAIGLVDAVVEIRMECHGQVRRDRPGRRRPDQRRDAPAGDRRERGAERRHCLARQWEFHVDRRRRVLVVLDLGFGQGSPAVDAPVHRLLAAVDHAAFHEPPERADDRGLIAVRHRQVGRGPGAKDAQALEIFPLNVDVLLGILATGPAEVGRVHLSFLGADLPVHLEFDRQAVTVPAWNVGAVEAGHRLGPDDEVLQDLVERGANVDSAVGVGWAVMEHAFRCVDPASANLRLEVHRFPSRDGIRLRLLETRLHRKRGTWEVECGLPVGHRMSSAAWSRN